MRFTLDLMILVVGSIGPADGCEDSGHKAQGRTLIQSKIPLSSGDGLAVMAGTGVLEMLTTYSRVLSPPMP